MKKKIAGFTLIVCMVMMTISCGTDDAVDQVANVVQAEDEHVLAVKNANNSNYPGVTYGDAFEEFFGSPAWKYFKGTQEGPDDDGDGEPDYVNEDIDVIEFTGYCTYSNVEVKALIQFALDEDAGTFEATYLSFNEVPQSTLTLSALLSKVFESYLGSSDTTAQVEETSATEVEQETESEETLYPEGMDYYKSEIDTLDIAGEYTGTWGQSYATINIYSSPENDSIGNASIYFDSESGEYGGDQFDGELTKVDKNLYALDTGETQQILLGITYDKENDQIGFEVWIDQEYVETFFMSNHFES